MLKVEINIHPACALVDCGLLGDFLLLMLVDQLKLSCKVLDNPVGLQLAVQGSQSNILATVDAHIVYRDISERQLFGIINLNDYDVILRTLWLYQHNVSVGFNPACIGIGSSVSIPIATGQNTRPLLSLVVLEDPVIMSACNELLQHTEPLCKKVEELIDKYKTYSWCTSWCPKIF